MKFEALGEVAEFVLDGTHGSPVRVEDGVPVLSAQNVKNGVLSYDTTRFTTSAELRTFASRLQIAEGDVLLTIVGTIGRAAVVREARPLVFQRSVAVIRTKREALDPDYLFYVTQSAGFQDQLRRSTNQSSQAGIYLGRLKNVQVPVPPLDEQRRIAAILDQADALRAKRREVLAHLDDLTQSIFLDMFGDSSTKNGHDWDLKSIGAVADIQGGLTINSARKTNPIQVPYLRVANVHRGRLELAEIKSLRATEREIDRTRLQVGDLLVVEGHGNADEIGRGALWDGSIDGCVHQNHLIRVRFDQRSVLPVYGSAFINSQAGRRHLLRAGKTTSGLNTISVSDVRSTPIVTPPVRRQEAFVHRLDGIRSLQALQKQAATHLDSLFASLQSRAFAGEL